MDSSEMARPRVGRGPSSFVNKRLLGWYNEMLFCAEWVCSVCVVKLFM